ncbi:molybdopterin-containing oxidoreductase family protein [Fulvivirga sedimenti]|uniref:Molybdopterin-dependent oxidoreductase n=1 Tax=Fulvivirga sedimenti TaxID=2879465 RepID=A0A9X1HRY6_9BACT|nr:molybdopterin-dependent oxidoreductase [Fulvivirga sedimenti]MCA6075439.1 molybdopterin-dependent oxidoreductase [Fulvivirga sedimenti]MCA6076616.1 molybdopterin-dependent oxidoreductase [Fulvivirga sedimenti]MCA6077744.1 molybdopterin-dependent oxidoreductase [Fulvivirga sedimenti]
MKKHHTFCRICESLCGLEVVTDGDKVVSVAPDPNHVATEGFSCVKGLRQHEMYQSPDRLKYPLKRMDDGNYERISWEQAISEIGAKVRKLRSDDGPDSIGMYVGTAAGFGVLHPVFAQGFMTGIGSKSMYASATQDCSNKFAVSRHMYGFPFTLPFPDLENTECLIVVGANPVISKWSFLQVPNPIEKLRQLERRGAKLYFVDPRKTESAQVAGSHVFIRPGTDVFFYLSFLHELIEQGGVDRDQVSSWTEGFDSLKELATNWPANRTEAVTGIPADVLSRMVADYISADGAALYCSTGVNMGGNGTLAFWIQESINAISGNLDRKGGTLVGKGIIDFIKFGVKNGVLMRDDTSRVGNFSAVNDAFPGGIMADEILTPGDRQLKALFVTGGNPLITMANSGRLRKAFRKLELLVTLDIYQNETSSEAHYVLPCTDPLQRPDLPFIFPLMLGLQMKPYLQATRAIVPPEGEQRDEASIYLDLARASGVSIFDSAVAQRFFEFTAAFHSRVKGKKIRGIPQESYLNGLLRLSRQKSFKNLLKHQHGIEREPHKPGSFLRKRVMTPDGKIQLAPEILLSYASKLETDFKAEEKMAGEFKLITKRAVTTHNSWTHNIPRMIAKGRDTNYAYFNPLDMDALGVEELDLVDISTDAATIRIQAKALDTLMPKTVAVPHGWGHQHARGLSVANKTRGVNVNLLAKDGPDNIDRVSGMAHLTGIPVRIRKSDGDFQPTWSGINSKIEHEE